MNLKRWSRRLSAAVVLVFVLAACGTPIAGESWAGLSTDGKYVYVAYKEQVFRIDTTPPENDPAHRHIEWLSQAPNKPHFYAAPAVSDDGAVYVGAYDKKFYAFRRDKGGALEGWTAPTFTDKVVAPATIAGDMVYVGMGDKGIRAYDRKSGQERSYTGTKYGVWAAPLVVNDTLYFTSLDHNLYALDAKTLTYKWQLDLGGSAAETPAFADGVLYVGTFDSKMLAIDSTSNPPRVLHTFQTNNWVWGTPALNNSVLYFGDLSGTVYALDAKTFEKKWSAQDAENQGGIRGSVAFVPDVKPLGKQDAVPLVIVGSESKYVYAYNATNGALVWKYGPFSDKVLSNMIIVKNDVIFTTLDENQLVVAINLSSGQIDWQISLSAEQAHLPTATPQP